MTSTEIETRIEQLRELRAHTPEAILSKELSRAIWEVAYQLALGTEISLTSKAKQIGRGSPKGWERSPE